MTGEWNLDDALAASGSDPGCDAVFAVLHEYVDEQLAGGDPGRTHPGLAAHLLSCSACREEYLGLIEASGEFGDAEPTDPATESVGGDSRDGVREWHSGIGRDSSASAPPDP